MRLFIFFLSSFFTLIPFLSSVTDASSYAPSGRPWRIITLGAPAVEIACALDLEANIVARATWTDWPPSIRSLPSVGDPGAPNIEQILRLKPDAVLIDAHFAALKHRLRRYNIPVYSLSAYNNSDVIPAIHTVAKRFGREQQARRLIADLESTRRLVTERLADLPPEERPNGLMLAGTGSLFSFSDASGRRLLWLSGANNICANMSVPYPTMNREWMVKASPDFLLMAPESRTTDGTRLLEWTWRNQTQGGPLSAIDCVRRGNLIVLDGALCYGLRSFFGAVFLARRLHPERFADVDPDALHAAFLRTYFKTEPAQRYLYP